MNILTVKLKVPGAQTQLVDPMVVAEDIVAAYEDEQSQSLSALLAVELVSAEWDA